MFRFNVCPFSLVVEIPKICICVSEVKMGKPSGIRTARKHVKNRRNQVWADKDYKKAHLGTRWKANPFGGASHAKGIVLEKVSILLRFTKRYPLPASLLNDQFF